MDDQTDRKPMGEVIQIDEARIRDHLSEMVRLQMPKLRRQTFETAIIERYRRRESSAEEALIEMYLAGVSVRRAGDITEALWGARVSPSTVSNLNKKIYAKVEAWWRASKSTCRTPAGNAVPCIPTATSSAIYRRRRCGR